MKIIGLLLTIMLLSACANKSSPPPEVVRANDVQLNYIVDQIKLNPESISYLKFWNTYLESQQVNATQSAYRAYEEKLTALNSNQLTCSEYDWNKLTSLNVISLTPRLLAIECYESTGDKIQQQQHENILNFIISGILGNHSGDSYYDAYEVATWGDAEDILKFAGYSVIDSYFEFKANRAGLYRVYLTRDPETQALRKIYFDNQRFIHQVLQIQFPFGGLEDHFYKTLILSLADTDYAAKLAQARVLETQKQFIEAEKSYLAAITLGSLSANIEFGKFCLSGNSPNFSLSECAQLFVTAAEQGLEEAKIYLAYMAYSGLGIEQDKPMAEDILASINHDLKPGETEYLLAVLFNSKNYAPQNEVLHHDFLQQAVAKNYPEAIFMQALYSIVEKKDSPEVLNQFIQKMQVAADFEHTPAQYYIAKYQLENSSLKDKTGALNLLNKVVKKNYPSAAYYQGRIYEYGAYGIPPDPLKAFLLYQQAGINWHSKAQLKLGYFSGQGIAVEKNYLIANGWYSLCARVGDLDCITNLGYVFEQGRGIDVDLQRAAELYQLASKGGLARASYNLGTLYEDGKGVPKDNQKAFELYQEAAEKGDKWAMNSLGLFYLEGINGEVDYSKALLWFEKSASQNYQYANYNLGRVYENGWGVEINVSKALQYYQLAAKRGHFDSKEKIKTLCQLINQC